MKQLGKYDILEPLGEGATSEVYRARDSVLNRDVALKILKPALVADPSAFERFLSEAQAAAGLFHAHIATVLDMGEAEGRYFIAMRYVPGRSLDQVLKEKPLSWQEALRMARQIGEALDFAHREGFLHRDVKPSNILQDQKGDYWLTDFGLTQALNSSGFTSLASHLVGTSPYIAPEIWDNKPASPASDQYALACVLFEALTGQVLFAGNSEHAIMKRHFDPVRFPTAWPEGTPSSLERVLRKALAKDPGERFPNAGAFGAALQALARHKPVPEPKRSAGGAPPAGHESKFSPWMLGAGLAGIIAISLFVGWLGGGGAAQVFPTRSPTHTAIPTKTLPPFLTATPEATSAPLPTATPELGIGSSWTRPADGMTMLYIPAGLFQMGSEDGDSDERPVHTVYLDAYWMDATEVTNAMFAKFLNDNGNQSEGGGAWLDAGDEDVLIVQSNGAWQPKSEFGDHPMVEVSWYGAQAYCAWAGARLPTEAEWEKAASWDEQNQVKYVYPWGNSIDCGYANFWGEAGDCVGDTTPAGSYESGKSPYGLYDMAGNVWEWTSSLYQPYPYQADDGREDPSSSGSRALRGGSWLSYDSGLRSAFRGWGDPADSDYSFGFRCARSR